jgi:thiopurine S-methyltransferase
MTTRIEESAYWEERYKNHLTGWDLGEVSPPIKAYVDQLEDKSIKILIPGAGNSYEAEYLYQKGFRNVSVLDFAHAPLENFKNRTSKFPENQLIHQNFFEHDDKYDLILEQTFFCALPPQSRPNYARKMHELLNPGGKLVGLLFTFPLTENGPPFGGSKTEYVNYFNTLFQLELLEECYNSFEKRQGNELFFKFLKQL